NLLLGSTVTAIDRAGSRVELADGSAISYDRLLLTMGASPRTLDVPGGDLGGVRYLRTAGDSERLGAALADAGRVVSVGAGWIGLEVAAAAREQGCEGTGVEPEPGALLRSLGPELGGIFADLHRAHGVTFRFGEGVSELRGSGGRVAAVITSSGAELPADLVVVGIGAVPNTALASVAGQEVSYDRVPYFYSDQYELGMETSGLPEPGRYDEIVYRGDTEGLEFIAFW